VENGYREDVLAVTCANLWHIQPQRPRPRLPPIKVRQGSADTARGRVFTRL